MCESETETSRFGRVLRRRFWIRNLKWILCIRMNVLGLTDECEDLWIFSLRSRRWFTPCEGNTQRREKAALFISSPPFSLSRALVLEISLFALKTTGACYAGLANLNPLKCNNSASGKISPTGFVQVMENLDSRGILWISFSRLGKSWNLIVSLWKSWKIIVLFGRLVTADDKARVT